MTSRPLKPCAHPLCSNLTTGRYCDDHRQQTQEDNRYYDKYQRDKRSNSFYHSNAWKKVRKLAVLKSNGLCVRCFEDNKLVQGYIVDHIIPVKEDWSKRLDLDNLQYLCLSCHNKKTNEDRNKY